MGKEQAYTDLVTLLSAVKDTISETFETPVWVKAEISSWSPRANGHCYLNLCQSRGGKLIAETRAMIWSWKYLPLKSYFEEATGEKLREGITVLVQVKVNYSELYGLTLYIESIDPAFTLGEKALEKKRLIERLEKGGYMEMQKELALPDLPRRIAVISSMTAAGYQDFRKHLEAGGYSLSHVLIEAAMQGEKAPESICAAIEEAAGKGFDAILILRGGGSETDLGCFDDETLAVTIAQCPVPVVTAIGHDKDVHIADMVANTSVKTPTALADLFLDIYRARDLALDDVAERIRTALEARHRAMELRLQKAVSGISLAINRRFSAVENMLQRCTGRIRSGLMGKYSSLQRLSDAAAHRVKFAAGSRIGTEYSALALKEARIKSTDPRNILSLGYVLVTGKDNKVLKSVGRVSAGDRIGVRFSDGSLTAKVDEVYSEFIDNKKVNIA
ncbi:MAG: exodeoxyribonuclease VII large subunit [Bacteroidales bacterium]|nr:exodeoxyribonuclease VII large subunit [Bacteroidales bacterium]